VISFLDNIHRTNPLRFYGYSIRGKPATHKIEQLNHNLTCTATISEEKVEFIRFFYEGGTTNEVFEDYISSLITTLKRKYPSHRILLVLDNLAVILFYLISLQAHKSSLVWKVM